MIWQLMNGQPITVDFGASFRIEGGLAALPRPPETNARMKSSVMKMEL